MPHYIDGTEAKLGDVVRGVSYNTKGKEVVGTIVQITPGSDTCNCIITWIESIGLPTLPDNKTWNEVLYNSGLYNVKTVGYPPNPVSVLTIQQDYGECKAFTLLKREND